MKKYTIELTTTELQKLQIFMLMYEENLLKKAEAYKDLANEYATIDTKTHDRFLSNIKWYIETYEIIHNLREKIDLIKY